MNNKITMLHPKQPKIESLTLEIVNAAIEDYTEAVNLNEVDEWFIEQKHMEFGLCNYFKYSHRTDIYGEIERKTNSLSLDKDPYFTNEQEERKRRLQVRLTWLLEYKDKFFK